MQNETKLTAKLIKEWRQLGAFVVNIHQGMMSYPGVADAWVATSTVSFWVEFKGPNTKVTDAQKAFHEQVNKTASKAYIVRFLTDTGVMVEDVYGNRIKVVRGDTFKEFAFLLLEELENGD